MVRRLAIERLALGEQALQGGAPVALLQQRAAPVARGAVVQVFHRAVQVDDGAALAQCAPVLLAQHHAAAGGEHDAVTLGEFVDHRDLAVTEAGLALYVEDPGDLCARTILDDVIRIEEGATERVSEVPADRGLAGTHEADKEDAAHAASS